MTSFDGFLCYLKDPPVAYQPYYNFEFIPSSILVHIFTVFFGLTVTLTSPISTMLMKILIAITIRSVSVLQNFLINLRLAANSQFFNFSNNDRIFQKWPNFGIFQNKPNPSSN